MFAIKRGKPKITNVSVSGSETDSNEWTTNNKRLKTVIKWKVTKNQFLSFEFSIYTSIFSRSLPQWREQII